MKDLELVQAYHRQGSETAFAELARRHVNLVYSAALRHVGTAAHAEEITQAVFIILARKAGQLRSDAVLESWLYETARLTSSSFLRGERRRQIREQEAYMQSTLNPSEPPVWDQIQPLLDDALSHLGKKDRDAVILRYFGEKSLCEVAAALNVTEAAAQSRVHRALEKLRKIFAKRGVTLTATVIAGAVSANSVQAAPAALIKNVTAVAIVKGSIATASTLTLVKGVLNLMAWAKAKSATLIGTGILVSCGLFYYSWQVPEANSAVLSDTNPQVKIVPTRFPDGLGSGVGVNDKNLGISLHFLTIIERAYGLFDDLKIVIKTKLPDGKYDYIANLPSGSGKALQQEITRQFGIIGRYEAQPKDVLVLKLSNATALKLTPRIHGSDKAGNWTEGHLWRWSGQPSYMLADSLEGFFQIPIIDETGLTNLQDFNFDINWDFKSRDPEKMKQALNEIGLELVTTNMPIEMLVVEKVK
jgi:uncharacterized protein (TIGR03435 family)